MITLHEFPDPELLVAQLRAARKSGATFVDEEFIVCALSSNAGEPDGLAVWLTFDDGYARNFTDEYLRVFEAEKVRPHVFLISAAVDPKIDVPARCEVDELGCPRPLARTGEIVRAVDAGWTVGSHTTTHFDCGAGVTGDWEREIFRSRTVLRDQTGLEIRTFAYPWGQPSNKCVSAESAIKSAGYSAAFSAVRGRVSLTDPSHRWFCPRDTVDKWWNTVEFVGGIRGALQR